MARPDLDLAAACDLRLLLLNPADNVLVARQAVAVGEALLLEGRLVRLAAPLRLGHKLARRDIAPDDAIIKYGCPIGFATCAIPAGAHVHLHNVRSGYTASVALAGSDGPGPYDAHETGARDG